MIGTSGAGRARRVSLWIASTLVVSGCGRLDSILYDPATTPGEWCEQRPCVDVGGIILNEPLGSFLVFLLAGLWIGAGLFVLAIRDGHLSRLWMGVALVVGGVAAALAGTSFQAFSFELKCAGRDLCVATNWFEVAYNITQAASVSAILVAVAYACTIGTLRRILIVYAIANTVGFVILVLIGAFIPRETLLSFELLILFAVPGLVAVLAVTGLRFLRNRDEMDLSLLGAGLLLVLVVAAYYAYLSADVTAQLWDAGNGFYFSENDVLHAGMIIWIVYVVAVVARRLRDLETGTAPGHNSQARL